MFSELHKRVFAKNAYDAGKMVKKGGLKNVYKVGQIVLLSIPRQNRLSVEASRLPTRVTKVTKGAYTLLTQYGPLKGRYQGSSLVLVISGEDFGIPIVPEKGAKAITLPAAVTKSNNRKSMSVLQKEGAKATRKRKRGPNESKYLQTRAERLAQQEAEAIAVQDEVDEQFACDVEESVLRRGESSITVEVPTLSPTPAARTTRKKPRKSVRLLKN